VAPRACNTEAVTNPMEVGPMPKAYKALPSGDRLQPGDIWRHNEGMGLLYVTDEDRDAHPGYTH